MRGGEEIRGRLTEQGPWICFPAPDVVALVAEDNTTIDMTFEQAWDIANRLITDLRGVLS